MNVLVIVPGGGDPNNLKYKKTYDLIIRKNDFNKKCKIGIDKYYDRIDIIPLYGHETYNNENDVITYWDCKLSAEIISSKLTKLDSDNEIDSYDIFARSGGCYVTLMSFKKTTPKKLGKIIFYGPATFDEVKTLFKDQYEETKISCVKKGLYINENTFKSFDPFENLICDYNLNNKIEVGFGKYDDYSNWVYADYISSVIKLNKIKNIEVKK